MARVTVSKEARNDLVSIQNYIREELRNPDAAQRILALLRKSIVSLETFPERGKPLDVLISVHTAYRYLLCENYCIFFLHMEGETLIVRILHQRQDSFKALFLSD